MSNVFESNPSDFEIKEFGSIKYKSGSKVEIIPLSEIYEVKFRGNFWTIFTRNEEFVTFQASNLISGFKHLSSRL